MKEKLKVKICTGTNCYILGGADLLTLEKYLPEKLKEKVKIEGCTCLNYCKDKKYGKPPFAIVGDELIAKATIPKLINKIKIVIENKNGGKND